ncbi:MAG: GNAT family N-acetyltransferase, partial [Burkholderiaceae bacterium]|nr:GNAT family N-acetyltransferase [Burkholderiaceae bacterium]
NTTARRLYHFDGKTNRALRYARNQKSPFEDEQDGNFILEPIVFENGKAIATGRLIRDGKIGRLAVLKQYRGQGFGGKLLRALVDHGKNLDILDFYLHAQTSAIGFYERLGFKPIDSEFNEAGIAHIKMVLEHR